MKKHIIDPVIPPDMVDAQTAYHINPTGRFVIGGPHGDTGQRVLNTEVVVAGACFHFPPGTVHRVTALEDTRIVEVSTPHLDDVVRLEDSYGRAGTSDP